MKYYNLLCRFATLRLKNRMDAEEVVSDVFFQIYSNRHRLTIDRSVRAYLVIATRNACLAFARKQAAQPRLVREEAAAAIAAPGTPESILESDEKRSTINGYIGRLPQRVQEVFLLSRSEGLSYAEIAEILEISERTVESHISKALEILRNQLPESTRARLHPVTKP